MEATEILFPQIQLFIACRRLSKGNSIVQIMQKRTNQGQWQETGRTEPISDNTNPDFVTNFTLNFRFEQQTYLWLRVLNSSDRKSLQRAQLIGQAQTTLGQIIGSPGQQIIKSLYSPGYKDSKGNIIIRTEEKAHSKQILHLKFKATNLKDNSGMFRSFKPFFYLSRSMQNGSNQKVFKSNTLGGKSGSWNQIQAPIQVLCNNDYARPIIFQVFDQRSSGNHDLIGSFTFTLSQILQQQERIFELLDPQKPTAKKNLGKIELIQMSVSSNPSFIDYIAGGCQISLLIAIDFTASNKQPFDPSSLHYLNPSDMNDYQKALSSVGEILLNYDTTKLVPLLGFGGKIQGMISHCFPCNFNNQSPHVSGINGILSTYRNSLQRIELSGPTLFSQILQQAVVTAEQVQINQQQQQYFVLLILTDGEIHDMKDTINWIVRGSAAPLSIVIVGLGQESFQNMKMLDADDEPLVDSRGIRMQRDIVQFVPFRNVGNSATRLAKEVLDQIPREILNYFSNKGILPNAPIAPATLSRLDTYGDTGYPAMQALSEQKGEINSFGIPPPNSEGFYTVGECERKMYGENHPSDRTSVSPQYMPPVPPYQQPDISGMTVQPNTFYPPNPAYPSYQSFTPTYNSNQSYPYNPPYPPNPSFPPNPAYSSNQSYPTNPPYQSNTTYPQNQSYPPNPSYPPNNSHPPSANHDSNPQNSPYYPNQGQYNQLNNIPGYYGNFSGGSSNFPGENTQNSLYLGQNSIQEAMRKYRQEK